jgi:hypothetical protein
MPTIACYVCFDRYPYSDSDLQKFSECPGFHRSYLLTSALTHSPSQELTPPMVLLLSFPITAGINCTGISPDFHGLATIW